MGNGTGTRPFTAIGFPDQEARETHFAVKIPWVMGLIGTRSLDTEIPGINDLVELAKTRIRDGIKAYDALMQIRATGKGAELPEEVRGTFAELGHELGYALLLKRYVDDPRRDGGADCQGRCRYHPACADAVLGVPHHGRSWHVLHPVDGDLLLSLRPPPAGSLSVLAEGGRLRHSAAVDCCGNGLVVAEFGRQPWIIEGVLPTAAAVSSLSASTVLITLLCFIAIYTVLFIVEMGLMLKAIRRPDPDHEPEAPLVPEKLVAAE